MDRSELSFGKLFFLLGLFLAPACISAETAPIRLNPEVIGEAAGEGLLDYTESGRRQRSRSYALAYLANVAHYHPDHVTVDNKNVVDHVLKHVRFMISGSIERTDPDRTPEPPCTGGTGSLGWNISGTAQAFAVIRHTPAIWDQLSEIEQDKVRWIVKAMAVAAQWTHHDGNDAQITLDGENGFKKHHNPNHQAGYLSVAIGAAAFFLADGTTMDDVLAGFDYDSWIAKFEGYKLLHIKHAWTAWPKVKDYMMNGGNLTHSEDAMVGEDGVRAPFTRIGISMNDPLNGWAILADLIFHWEVQSVIANRRSDDPERQFRCKDGAVSPFEGRYGMMYEFNAGDGSGQRSSILYSQVTWRMFSLIQATLMTCGYMPENEMARDIYRRFYVGSRDLFFKSEHEWFGRANGDEKWESWTPALYEKSMFDDYTGGGIPEFVALHEEKKYEAESAAHILEPMTVTTDESASGGKFVEIPLGTGDNPDDLETIDDTTGRTYLAYPDNPMYPGQMTVEVTVERSRYYRIEALTRISGRKANNMYFSSERSLHKHYFGFGPDRLSFPDSEEWRWAEVTDSVFFRKGANRFLLAWNEEGVQIDKFRIVSCGTEPRSFAENGSFGQPVAESNTLNSFARTLAASILRGRIPSAAPDSPVRLIILDTRGRRLSEVVISSGTTAGTWMKAPGAGLYLYQLSWEEAGRRRMVFGRIGKWE